MNKPLQGISFSITLAVLLVFCTPDTSPPIRADGTASIQAIIEQARARRRARKDRKRMKQGIAAFLALGGAESLDALPCMFRHGVNLLYLNSKYYPAFAQARKQNHSVIIMGDSTGAINALVSNWMNPKTTFSIAVPGNRLCHMRMTFRKSMPAEAPRLIIVTTLGGNDLLAGAEDDEIVAQTLLLLLELRKQFPETLLVGVGIHPTLVEFANKRKDALNLKLAAVWKKDSRGCWVDPLPAFGTIPGGAARPDQMFPGDSIHYNQRSAMAVGKLIRETCKVDF